MVGDDLPAKDSVTMKVTLTYQDFTDPSLLPTEDVSISNLGITITYVQSGSALVKDNGEVADYRVYHQGDKITLNNEDYYVIANSGADKDYVVALKENPLTPTEVNTYGDGLELSTAQRNGYMGVAYGNSSDYSTSKVKLLIEAWAADTFQNNELKEVNEYSARLITKTEYEAIPSSYTWRYNNVYTYWTMTPSGTESVYDVRTSGSISDSPYTRNVDSPVIETVRPVINVYKSALETNNNSE